MLVCLVFIDRSKVYCCNSISKLIKDSCYRPNPCSEGHFNSVFRVSGNGKIRRELIYK